MTLLKIDTSAITKDGTYGLTVEMYNRCVEHARAMKFDFITLNNFEGGVKVEDAVVLVAAKGNQFMITVNGNLNGTFTHSDVKVIQKKKRPPNQAYIDIPASKFYRIKA